MRQFLTLLIPVILIMTLFASCSRKTPNTTDDKTVSSSTSATSATTTSVDATENSEIEEKSVIELVAGEQGEYGTLITFNKGTEFEQTVIAYHIPAGEYTVTNIGEYMNQFNIYSDETHITDEGWEEPAEGIFVKLMDVGATEEFTIKDGQYIKIVEPGKFRIEQK